MAGSPDGRRKKAGIPAEHDRLLTARIVTCRRASVILHDGEELQLELSGDLGERNAGMLIFVDGRERPEYVPWIDVEQVDLDRPPRGHR